MRHPSAAVALLLIGAALLGTACASSHPAPPVAVATPKFPAYPDPSIPPSLPASQDVRNRQATGWQRLQSGDLRGANRDFSAIVKKTPDFYPSITGLGFALLADRQFKAAAARFSDATTLNDRYLPAWMGQADAQLGLKNDAGAIAAMEHILSIDPGQTAIQSRLELVRFRQVQSLIEQGRRSRLANRLPEAAAVLNQALALSPQSTAILHELILVEVAGGNLDAAEEHARMVVQLTPTDAEAYALLGDLLEKRERYGDAAAAFLKAASLDARPEWRKRAADLRVKANLAAIPAEFANIERASSITRGQIAAFIGIKLEPLVSRAPKRPAGVVTDMRNHWAEPWALPIVQAGIMDVYANHTFQPETVVRRNDLAQIVSRLVALAAPAADVARWRAARPRFADLPATNVFYRSAALAVASGAMTADADRFLPAQPATGADLSAAVARVEQAAAR